MNNLKIYNRILEINKPESGYIVFKYDNSSNYFGKDENDYIVFMIKSQTRERTTNIQETKSLIFIYNKECSFYLDDILHREKVHILICKSEVEITIQTFLRLSQIFSIDSNNSKDKDYLSFFSSLVQLFDKENNIGDIEAQGVLAELLVIRFLAKSNCDILQFWQSKSKMKFDFMVGKTKRVEIKSTLKSTRSHHFLHEQLLTSLYDIVIVSVLLQKSDKGISIFDISNDLKKLFPFNYNFNLFIETYLSRLNNELLYNTKYDETHFLNNIRFFKAQEVPKLMQDIPKGVFNIEYNVVLDNINDIKLNEFINWLGEGNV